jgi:CRP-like cAMP-binding protein
METLTSELLKKYDYFSGLSEGALEELAKKLETLDMTSGTEIIKQGIPADYFYFVKKGEVEVCKTTKTGQKAKLSVVSSGQGFGEVALLTCSHRSCSVHAKTDVSLYRLSKTNFEDIIIADSSFTGILLKKVKDYAQYNKMKTLQPFALLEPEKMLALTDKLMEGTYAPGDNIINQGEQGDFFYIIKSGRVAVLVKKGEGNESAQVAVLSDGESFGEEALIRDQRRNATVRTLEDTIVLALDRKDFDQILKTSFLEYTFPEDFEEIPADKRDQYVFLDARIPPEYEEEHIEGAVNIPLEILRQTYPKMDPSKEYLTYCTNDSRGMAAAFLLRSQGFNAKNLRGGLSGWTGSVASGSDGIHLPG